MPDAWATVVLAAGRGTRMRSKLPKMLHPVAGVPLLVHVIDALMPLSFSRTVIVASKEIAEEAPWGERDVMSIIQDPPLGTGDAVRQALTHLTDTVTQMLVVNGDMPLITSDTLAATLAHHESAGAALTIVSCRRDNPSGLGRVMRAVNGDIIGIIEEAELGDSPLVFNETNEGIYCIDVAWAHNALAQLKPHSNSEYYLTDIVAMAADTSNIACLTLSTTVETAGVNDRVQLAAAETVMRQRVREALMRSGVSIIDPATAYIDAGVTIGQDSVIYPNTTISGRTEVGSDCRIGPNTTIRDSHVGDECHIDASTVEEAVLESHIDVGPYSHLRPGAHIEQHVHIGNYVEIKNSRIGQGTLVGHFSYIGDATLGADVNVGAGTITCNYDGVDKHPTIIGNNVFLGSDTMLVAPVTVGDGATTGAGAVVTHDVPPHTTVAGVPARPMPERRAKKGQ